MSIDVPGRGRGLQVVSRQTLADSVYEQLKTAIIRGRLRDGTVLKQVELGEKLGVSRVPVREALRRLQAEHLVVTEPFQCFVVTSLSRDQIMELLELREELEVFALKRTLASPSRSARLKAGKAAAKALDVDADDDAWLEADREFHRVINGETTAVATLVEDVRERVQRYLFTSGGASSRRHAVKKEHAAILAALGGTDEVSLEAAIRKHVRNTRNYLEHTLVSAGPSEENPAKLTELDLIGL